MNDFLNELLNGVASTVEKPITLRAAAQAASAPATNIARQFQIPGALTVENFAVGKNTELVKSERGCYLAHDLDNKLAILVDENRQANLISYDEDAS